MSQTHSANTLPTSMTIGTHRARMTPPALVPDCKPFPELEIFLSNSPVKENLTHILLKDIS